MKKKAKRYYYIFGKDVHKHHVVLYGPDTRLRCARRLKQLMYDLPPGPRHKDFESGVHAFRRTSELMRGLPVAVGNLLLFVGGSYSSELCTLRWKQGIQLQQISEEDIVTFNPS